MESASLRIFGGGRARKTLAAVVAREPLAVKGLVASVAIATIHLIAPRVGLSGQITQDLATLVDPRLSSASWSPHGTR